MFENDVNPLLFIIVTWLNLLKTKNFVSYKPIQITLSIIQ